MTIEAAQGIQVIPAVRCGIVAHELPQLVEVVGHCEWPAVCCRHGLKVRHREKSGVLQPPFTYMQRYSSLSSALLTEQNMWSASVHLWAHTRSSTFRQGLDPSSISDPHSHGFVLIILMIALFAESKQDFKDNFRALLNGRSECRRIPLGRR